MRASAAAAEAGTTPSGPVGDALKAWIESSEGVELEGVYLGDARAQFGFSGGWNIEDNDDDSDRSSRSRNVGVFAARDGGLEEGEAYIAVPWRLVIGAHAAGALKSPSIHVKLRVYTHINSVCLINQLSHPPHLKRA